MYTLGDLAAWLLRCDPTGVHLWLLQSTPSSPPPGQSARALHFSTDLRQPPKRCTFQLAFINLIDDGVFPQLRAGARLFFDVRTKEMLKHVIQVVGSLGSRAARQEQ